MAPVIIEGYMYEVEIFGEPCLVEVRYFYVQEPNLSADNPDDYYGYTEIEFDIYDIKGKWNEEMEERFYHSNNEREKDRINKVVINMHKKALAEAYAESKYDI